MAGMYGADVARLRDLASRFESEAGALEQAATTVTRGVQAQFWAGPVAVRFKASWEQQHRPGLAEGAQRLKDAAAVLRRNADEQERASAAGGGATTGVSGSSSGGGTPTGASGSSAGGGSAKPGGPAKSVAGDPGGAGSKLQLNADGWARAGQNQAWGFLDTITGGAASALKFGQDLLTAKNGAEAAERILSKGADLTISAVKKMGPLGYAAGLWMSIGKIVAEDINDPNNNTDYSAQGVFGALLHGFTNPGTMVDAMAEGVNNNIDRIISAARG